MPSTDATTLRNRLRAKGRFRHMQAFVEVALVGSVRRAAISIGLTQPAVSHLLRDLENLLGAELFSRQGRGMRLTSTGTMLLPVAQRILKSLDESAIQADAIGQATRGYVRVAALINAIHGVLSFRMAEFYRRWPSIVVDIVECIPESLAARLAHGDADIGLCRASQLVPAGWRFEPLMADHFVVVAAATHPIMAIAQPDWSQLRQQTWLSVPPGTAARVAFDQLFADDGPAPPTCQINSIVPILLWRLLMDEPLLALLPASTASPFLVSGMLKEVPLPRRIEMPPIGMMLPPEPASGAPGVLAEFLRAQGGARP